MDFQENGSYAVVFQFRHAPRDAVGGWPTFISAANCAAIDLGLTDLATIPSPSTLSESYGYDAVGNLTSKTDRKNQTIQYVYDALNRMTQKTYPDSTSANYVYDLVGKIKQVSDPTGTCGFAYDNMGRLIGTTTQYASF